MGNDCIGPVCIADHMVCFNIHGNGQHNTHTCGSTDAIEDALKWLNAYNVHVTNYVNYLYVCVLTDLSTFLPVSLYNNVPVVIVVQGLVANVSATIESSI